MPLQVLIISLLCIGESSVHIVTFLIATVSEAECSCVSCHQFLLPSPPTEGEELVIPASREEVDQFIEATVANCQTLLELSLPLLEAILPSKRFYELLYNRYVMLICFVPSLSLPVLSYPILAWSSSSCIVPRGASAAL